MYFDFGTLVSYISQWVTLLPGDIIWSGTTGDPENMNPGDLEVEVEGIACSRTPSLPSRDRSSAKPQQKGRKRMASSEYTEQELANIAVVRAHIEGFGNRDVEQALSVLADDVIDEDFGEPPKHGKAEIRQEIEGYLSSFPDLRWEIVNVFAHDDQVLIEIKARATRGPNPVDGGKPGTKVDFWVASVEHVSDGKIDHMKAYIAQAEVVDE